ncbi:hypothetical protein PHYSODRAFT_312602 [Phytophthora sojae]|uniref:non-specific serine/threonine protein kinase n=1 Tax=Phytophthora sojae (strain P6497) TaxID=1094619 RepID=G4Z2Z3_PHYSP|nr:hypothetical protein PHYSODRAFT_312602 [Phytophthora sojae]EGZ19326.1 hypothetical protein PHYSODRAFT_312602 [Phytophthora sojae]|eukprot:XP_009522043.1 hypothetical protein PHYSODRAFT_312602 [Phytophthora sojae]
MAAVELPVKSLDEYKRLAHIGRGTYGDVFLCEHVQTGERCLFLGRTRCLNEVALLQQLPAHPNIVKLYEAFWAQPTEGGEQALVLILEHADGGDLEQVLSASIVENEARRIFSQLAQGVHHLHTHRVVHRDLKCANVFLFQSGRVVLGDFGTSKRLTPISRQEQEIEAQDLSSTVVGSLLYMSPELLEGEPHGFATDIWSLGCVLYELLSGGKAAFASPSYPAVVFRITQDEYDPLDTDVVSPQARDLVSRMLRKMPQERPTIAEVLQSSWLKVCGTIKYKTVESVKHAVKKGVGASEEIPTATSHHTTDHLLPPAPVDNTSRDMIMEAKEIFISPPPAPHIRPRSHQANSLHRHKEIRFRVQDQAASPLIRFDEQPPPPPMLPSSMSSMIPFKHNYQRQHHNSIQTESLALEVRGVQMVKNTRSQRPAPKSTPKHRP